MTDLNPSTKRVLDRYLCIDSNVFSNIWATIWGGKDWIAYADFSFRYDKNIQPTEFWFITSSEVQKHVCNSTETIVLSIETDFGVFCSSCMYNIHLWLRSTYRTHFMSSNRYYASCTIPNSSFKKHLNWESTDVINRFKTINLQIF